MQSKALLYFSILAASSLFADGANQTSMEDYRPEGVTTQPKNVITPPVAPRVNHGVDLAITADFIWWKSTLSDQEYAQRNRTLKSPNYSFEPGFKVGLGLDMGHDGWDVAAEYTWLYGPSLKSRIGPSSDYATSKRFQHFNVLDLELGRNFFISKRLTLRPQFGMKFAWTKDRDYNQYFTDTYPTREGVEDYSSNRYKQALFGVGLRAGIDTVWHFTRSWGLYSDIALTALWGYFKDRRKDISETTFLENNDFVTSTSTSYTNTTSQNIVPVIELGAGLTYMTWFYDENYMFSLKAGWEEQIWISYLRYPNRNVGNLNIQGLTIKAAFAF